MVRIKIRLYTGRHQNYRTSTECFFNKRQENIKFLVFRYKRPILEQNKTRFKTVSKKSTNDCQTKTETKTIGSKTETLNICFKTIQFCSKVINILYYIIKHTVLHNPDQHLTSQKKHVKL